MLPAEIPEGGFISKKESDRIREEVDQFTKEVQHAFIELAKRLHFIRENKLHKRWGFRTFADYCDREVGEGYRKCRYLADISKTLGNGLVSDDDLERVGWSKAKILVPLVKKGAVTEKNIQNWLTKISNKSLSELRDMEKIATSQWEDKNGGDGGVEPEEIYRLPVILMGDQWENAQIALKKAENITGSDKLPWLMDCIFMSFNSEGFSTKEEGLDEMCRRIERVYSVRLVALHGKSNAVLHGEEILKILEADERAQESADS